MASKTSKINYATFNLTKFNFRPNKTNILSFLLRKLFGNEGRISPVLSPRRPLLSSLFFFPKKHETLKDLGEAVGFDSPVYLSLLQYHQDRLTQEYNNRFIIYMLTACTIFFTPIVFLVITITANNTSPVLSFLLVAVSSLYLFVAAGIAMRFSQFVTFRYFSDSLCAETLVFLIVELAHCDNPLTPVQKKLLLMRTDFLAKATRSLISQYDLNANTLDWAKNHFRQIEFFIQEREKWIITPKDSTLDDLQQDFYHLAQIFISGNFGNFKYETGETVTTNETPNNSFKRFVAGIPRITVGVIIPISGLLLISLRPDLFANILDIKVLALICLGWLLLAVDVMLKLGIVSSAIGIAKGIKDLA